MQTFSSLLRFGPWLALSSFLGVAAACSTTVTPNPGMPAPDAGPSAAADTGPGAQGDDGATGNPADAGPDVDVTPVTEQIQKFDADYAKAVCAKLTSCCKPEDFKLYFARFINKEGDKGTNAPFTLKEVPSEADCETALKGQLDIRNGLWALSVAKGRMAFEPARAGKCVASVTAAACGTPLAKALYDDACVDSRLTEVFKKLVPAGGACNDIKDGTFYGECDPKQGFCGETDADAGASSPKTCIAWRKPGESCSLASPRRFCRSSDGSYCVGQKCSTPPAVRNVGEDCGDFAFDCVAGAFCDAIPGDKAATKKCVAARADGEACAADDQCVAFYPYSCDLSAPGAAKTCGSTKFCGGK
jgi:hypothetical protein